jgi:hypothetical protein
MIEGSVFLEADDIASGGGCDDDDDDDDRGKKEYKKDVTSSKGFKNQYHELPPP